jgi:hypothetical protein
MQTVMAELDAASIRSETLRLMSINIHAKGI